MNVWIIFSIFCFLVLVICFIYLLKKSGDILHNLEYTAWESLSDALQSENFHKTSEIRLNKTIYCKTKNDYIPNVIVSVDTVGERLAVSYISEEIKNEKNVITGYKLASDYFNFSEITGGQILTGGRASRSIGSAVGTASNGFGTALTSGTSYATVRSMQYMISLNNIDKPTYTFNIFNEEIMESSPAYKSYTEKANSLDALIRRIVQQNEEKAKEKNKDTQS